MDAKARFSDGYIESFNGKLCDECLNENIFVNLQEAKRLVETCREEYNENCPHNSLDGKTPNEMAREEEKLNGTSIQQWTKEWDKVRKCHDYRLFKESKVGIHPKIKAAVDTGYQGLQKMHAQTRLPKKKSKRHPLTQEDKEGNTALAKEHALVENVIEMLKRFKIIAERYRNRRKRFGLRFNLLAGLYNWELKIQVSEEL